MAKSWTNQQQPSQGSANPTKRNGSSSSSGSDQASPVAAKPARPTSTSKSSTVLNYLMAVCALIIGLITPVLWNLHPRPPTFFPPRTLLSASGAGGLSCNDEALSLYLHDEAVPGLHVVCFQEGSMTFYKDAVVIPEGKTAVSVDASQITNWESLRNLLVEHLALTPTDELHQPWATYSGDGQRYLTEIDDGSNPIDPFMGMFLVFQGGQWIWPGVRKGFKRVISIDEHRNATLETLSLYPLVLSVEGFLTMDECAQIQTTASPSMRYADVTLMDKDKGRPASDFRTSQTTFLSSARHSFLRSIDRKTASLVRLPVTHQEDVQVLRYGETEKYDSHHDYFEPSLYQQDPGTLSLIQKGRRNRMITVFWYLSDVERGGETVFPSFDKLRAAPKHLQCESGGLRVRPEAGKVIVFYSQTPNGALDPDSLHGACPVKEGVKWAANKWVWNAPMGFVQDS